MLAAWRASFTGSRGGASLAGKGLLRLFSKRLEVRRAILRLANDLLSRALHDWRQRYIRYCFQLDDALWPAGTFDIHAFSVVCLHRLVGPQNPDEYMENVAVDGGLETGFGALVVEDPLVCAAGSAL